jgi:hypothetical protein
MILAVCSKDPSHKRFITRVVVTADWVVDEHGEKLGELLQLGSTIVPGPGNAWTCAVCGAPATLKETT